MAVKVAINCKAIVQPATAINEQTVPWFLLSRKLAGRGGERVVEAPVRSGFAAGDPSFADLQELGTRLIKSRQNRVNFVSESLLNEAAWGILLDLAVAGLKGERVATSSACASAQVPLSTALRHVNLLIKAGWVKRVGDPKDKRRTFIELQPHSFDLMVKYLRANWEVFAAKPSTDRTLSGHRHAA